MDFGSPIQLESMTHIYELSGSLLEMKADIKAEVIARELLESGDYLSEDMLIIPAGAFKRMSSRDVISLVADSKPDEKENLTVRISTSREGITDMIPPGIMHQPVIAGGERPAEVVVKDMEVYEAEFNQARTFFRPFDIEFGHQRIFLETLEHHSLTDTFNYYGQDLYSFLWPDLKLELSLTQQAALLELTIHAHNIAGDLKASQQAMINILGQPVLIEHGIRTDQNLETLGDLNVLGKSSLGTDWILFEQYLDYDHVNIIIGPVDDMHLTDFRYHSKTGKSYELLEFLCDLLLPVELSWKMILLAREAHFQINRKKETAILGYSTVLG